jgi:hypothetical protein
MTMTQATGVRFDYDLLSAERGLTADKCWSGGTSRQSMSSVSVFDTPPETAVPTALDTLLVPGHGHSEQGGDSYQVPPALTDRAAIAAARRVDCLGGWSFLLLVLGIFCLLPGTIVTGIYVREA